MGMVVEQKLHVLQAEAELFHAVADQRHGLFEAAVDQDVPLRGRDEK